MKQTPSIQLKAALLLTVFAINTIVGFACSIRVVMGFNTKHYGAEATEAVVHIHKDGKKHIHQEKKESYSQDTYDQHAEAKKSDNSKSEKGDCCTDKVKEFQNLDKSLPASQSIIHPVFSTGLVAGYYNISLLLHTDIIKDIKPFVRSYHPPIPDIRIAIQSFQI